MKTILLFCLIPLLALSALAQEKTVKAVNSVADLVTLNANYQNTVYVAEGFSTTDDGQAGIWRYYSDSVAATNTTCVKPNDYPGRWIRLIYGNSSGGSGGGSIWTNSAGTVQLTNLVSNSILKLSADDGAGTGSLEFWTTASKRWTLGGSAFYPESGADFGTSGKPVGTIYVGGPTGVLFGDRIVSSSTGDPEGARIAPVGSLFLRSDGIRGYTLYSKVTGTGNTGWDAVPSSNAAIGAIGLTIDGGGTTITTGIKGDIYVPYDAVITSVTLLADVSGAVVVDIWKNVYGGYPPTVANSITASAKPTIVASNDHSTDTTLTGWGAGKTISAGDTLRFNVDSATTIQRLTLTLKVLK